jgi:hypothetical protein
MRTAKKRQAAEGVFSDRTVEGRFKIVVTRYVSHHATKAAGQAALKKLKLTGVETAVLIEVPIKGDKL